MHFSAKMENFFDSLLSNRQIDFINSVVLEELAEFVQ